jgi:H+/Cl- antiporter ClcA
MLRRKSKPGARADHQCSSMERGAWTTEQSPLHGSEKDYDNDENENEGAVTTLFADMNDQDSSSCTPLQQHQTTITAAAKSEFTQLPSSATTNESTSAIAARCFRSEAMTIIIALVVGSATGFGVSVFKLSIEHMSDFVYGMRVSPFINIKGSATKYFSDSMEVPAWLIPALGGLCVSLLRLFGPDPPGLRAQVAEVNEELSVAYSDNADGTDDDDDDDVGKTGGDDVSTSEEKKTLPQRRSAFAYLRKFAAATCTLGTGNSLGPEGTAVEMGMAASRVLMSWESLTTKLKITRQEQKLFLACGAAAGVSAGFNAPISAVFFAFEIVQAAFNAEACSEKGIHTTSKESLSSRQSVAPLMVAAVASAMLSRSLLKDHMTLVLSSYSLTSPLIELPVYLLLGSMSGVVAFVFNQLSKDIAHAYKGTGPVWTRCTIARLPPFWHPVSGGLVCGLMGLVLPQVLFFGYSSLNSLLDNKTMPTWMLLSLLAAKTFATALAVGSGLVGGVFAPALFLGSMLGASVHNVASTVLAQINFFFDITTAGGIFSMSDVPAYTMVGAASTLAALCQAPLTGSLLVFELTKSYDVILPLLTAAGVGSLVHDIIAQRFNRSRR